MNIKLYYYLVLKYNNDKYKNIFFKLVLENKEIYVNEIISLLLKWKSFCNKELTKQYVKELTNNNFDNINDIIYYLIDGNYCRILHYLYNYNKSTVDIDNVDNTDYKINTSMEFIYNPMIIYSDDEITKVMDNEFEIYRIRFELRDDLYDEKYKYYRTHYFNKYDNEGI